MRLEGFEAQQYSKPDLVFLDVEMPGIGGIIITSHPEYALEGFELSALDYLLKPLTEERFTQAAPKIRDYWEMRQKPELYDVHFERDMLTIKEGYNRIRLAQRGTIYLEAMQDYTKMVTSNKNYLTLSTLSFFMEQLPADRFISVHRSYAVSLQQIKELRNSELLCDNTVIPVGKTFRSAVSKLRL